MGYIGQVPSTTFHSGTNTFTGDIKLEGATANDYETSLTVVDPTADRTITFPDASGTVALTSDLSNSSSAADDITTGDAAVNIETSSGNITMDAPSGSVINFNNNNSNVALIDSNGFRLNTGKNLSFEGATDNSNETTLTVTDPTADRTITLPNVSGTVLTTANADVGATTTSSSDADHVLIDDGGALKKITPANLGIGSGGGGGSSAYLGAVKLLTTTISNDATVEVGSTYITDDYDYYDVILSNIIPVTDARYLGCRLGVGGVISTGSSDYGYSIYHMGFRTSDNYEFNNSNDGTSTLMLLTSFSGLGELGNGTGESFNGHYRFYNLRSTTFYKGVTHMDTFGFSANQYHQTSRKGLAFGAYNINRESKVDTIQFLMESGNIASGTMTVYGWTK